MGRPPKAAPDYCISQILMDLLIYSLNIPYIYIYSLNIFHIFSLVCFLIYGVKNSFGHEQITTFGSISHVSGPKLAFSGNFTFVRYHFRLENSRVRSDYQKTQRGCKKKYLFVKMLFCDKDLFSVNQLSKTDDFIKVDQNPKKIKNT